MEPEIEASFVRAFAKARRRPRYLQLLAKPERRGRFLALLHHDFEVDERYATAGGWGDLGGPTDSVYFIGWPLDGLSVPLKKAFLDSADGGFIVIRDPVRLALYQPEEPAKAVLLVKPRRR